MDWNADYIKEREKTKFMITIGCLFGVVITLLLIISVIIWLLYEAFVPDETQLMVSDSPNNINQIELVEKEDPLRSDRSYLRIYYDDEIITRTKLPDDISIEWENDYEAYVTLTNQGREPD